MSSLNDAVIIGRKSTMNYVVACITLFNSGFDNIKIKARGRSISRAIETVEMLKRAFIKELEIKKIIVGSQEYEKYGKIRNISTIEMTLTKPTEASSDKEV